MTYREESPSRPPWVFLHGLLRQGSDGAPLFGAVAPDYTIFSPDHAGHGRAGVRLDSYCVVEHLPHLESYLAGTVGVPAIVYGHSMGAMLAAALAAKRPDLVRAVILEDPPFHTMGARLAGTVLHGYFSAIRPCVGDRSLTAARLGAVRVPISTAGTTALLSEVREAAQIRYMAKCFSEADPRILDPVIAGTWLDGYDVEAVLRGLRCPALLLQSDPAAGGMLTDEDVAAAVRLGADVTAVRMANGIGHQAHWQDTAGVLRHMLAFLGSLEQ